MISSLRERAVRRSQHDRHADLWQALGITFGSLARGEAHLGLPALGGLFDADQCAWLDGVQLENRWLLDAVFQLGWFRADGGLTRVNYRDMGPEELGSVYESLLELVPDLQMLSQPATARLAFVGDDDSEGSTKGNTRKLTGSYYTPDSLVQELIKTALEPVIADTVRGNPERPVEALLGLTICDPACGSGHFLLSAARRLADEVALHRAAAEREGGAPTPVDYRHALRDVVSHCIFGVDKNPMAIQLAKTALWLEAYSPDRPLSFIDHHLRVGDALLGVLDPKVLDNGIPDEAYTALSGDDKAVASALKKQNKADLKSWKAIAAGDLFTQAGLASRAVTVEALDDDTPEHLAAKRKALAEAEDVARNSPLARLADTYVAAFLAPKVAEAVDTVPLSGYLWGVLTGQSARPALDDAAQTLCRQHGVFHWWLIFPQVATQGGFSVMLGNPPWEMLQLDPQEFFAAEAPSIANAQHMAAREKLITALRDERPHLYQRYWAAVRATEAVQAFMHSSGRYPHSGFGRINLASLFAESCLQAVRLRSGGRAGLVLPSGIAIASYTQHLFNAISAGNLVSLFDFENREAIFAGVHRSYRFCLLTMGSSNEAQFQFFAGNISQLTDLRRRFRLTPEDLELLNPNTRTCPIFRSYADAKFTKKLYRSASVLWREQVVDAEGAVLEADVNPWGVQLKLMFMMNTDSGLFHNAPRATDAVCRLPLYEGKMIHQFDHRWATYPDAPAEGAVEPVVVTTAQKVNPDFAVRPRYWVDEREVLARIARVPSRVTKGWLGLHAAEASAPVGWADAPLVDLLEALAAWVAGELFARAAGVTTTASDTSTTQQTLAHILSTQGALRIRFPRLHKVLQGAGLTTKKALTEFPKWATQNRSASLNEAELKSLADALQAERLAPVLLDLLDEWMDRRSPRWLMGWRDITNATNERTVIASVAPRAGVGNNMPLMLFSPDINGALLACLLGNLGSLTFDFVARHKVGGMHLSFFIYEQLPVLPPERYGPADLNFIVPRVLELTYTAQDLATWAQTLAAYDYRPADERGRPFAWSSVRRAQLRAELDSYYARLYGLTRDELRYILDPADVMGPDYPTETFRVLKNNEMREFGEYRTQRMVLEAWDKLGAAPAQVPLASPAVTPQLSELGMIRNEEEALLAGLMVALVEYRPEGSSVSELQFLVARLANAAQYLDPSDALRFTELSSLLGLSKAATQLLSRALPIVQRLESVGVLTRQARAGGAAFTRGGSIPPGDVRQVPEHGDVARLLVAAESRRLESERAGTSDSEQTSRSTGTR